jgi:glycosyltransferase involved in cell wall biosynthesis
MKKISVMIPTYNQASYLTQAVNSALAQDYPNLEVIISDDCSCDNTQGIIEKFNDRRLKYYRNSANIGRASNYRKLLYEYATGDYVINLDGDDFFNDKDYLSKAMEYFKKDDGVVLVFANQNVLHEQYSICENTGFTFSSRINGNWIFINYLRNGICIPHVTAVYKRRDALNLDFYRLDIESSDWESILRLIIGREVGFLQDTVATWRIHGGNESSKKNVDSDLLNITFIESLYDFASSCGFDATELKIWKTRMLKAFLRKYIHKYISCRMYIDVWKILKFASHKSKRLMVRLVLDAGTMLRCFFSSNLWVYKRATRLYSILTKSPIY